MNGIAAINRYESSILFVGDVIVFYVSLWLTLAIRNLVIPSEDTFLQHVVPFSLLFIVWFGIFFIAGLYEKHTTVFKSRLFGTVLRAQIINVIIAALFFFLIPYFGITPKTNLFIYLVISFTLVLLWRQWLFGFVGSRKQQRALLIAAGDEMHEIETEVNANPRYGMRFIKTIDLDAVDSFVITDDLLTVIRDMEISTVVIDTYNPKVAGALSKLYELIFAHVRFINMHVVYEDIFDRVPLSLVQHSWFLENIAATQKPVYETLKRMMDIVIAAPLFILSVPVYPVVMFVNRFANKGILFYEQYRTGRFNQEFRMLKFRSMTGTDTGDEMLKTKHTVTPFGKMLRVTRIDELPQLWSVLKGDLSLIGPRPEFPAMIAEYDREIPYYNIRHLIAPGLSGWAQIYQENHPHHSTAFDETREKLSYDLYYVKNRSLLLDLRIALKTVKALASRTGM